MLERFNHRFNPRRRHRGGVVPQRGRSRSLRIESLERRELLAGDLAITELMAANSSILEDTDHETPDWIEIHNAGTERVDLTGWRLTDSLENLDKWEFPSTFIEPDQYLLVLASGKDRQPQSYLLTTDLHATADATFAVDLPAGEYTLQVTMGDADRARDNMAIYVQGELRETFSAAQREFVVKTLPAEVSDASGGQLLLRIEDRGGETLRAAINALTITSATGDATWQFDFGEATSPVEPGYVAVTADDTYAAGTGFGWLPGADISDQDRGLTQSELHTNFQLSADGESVALVSPAGDVISAIGSEPDGYPPQYADISYGVIPATNPSDPPRVGYFMTPSPGAANDVNRMIAGPAIRNVTDSPGLLDDHDDLIVTATIDPTNAEIASAALTYRVMFGSEVIVPMVDDGTGSDITAGDGVFTGVIPHTASVPGEMLRWYVTAVDTVGYGNRAPLFTGVQVSPGLFTFRNDFSSGTAAGFDPQQGTWQVIDGRYRATPGAQDNALTIVPALSELTDDFDITATITTRSGGSNENGAVIFDYHSAIDFKFALVDTQGRRLALGHRDASGWNILTERTWPLDRDTDYSLRIAIQGTYAAIWVGNVRRLQHNFGESLADGLVGLGSDGGVFDVDDVVVTPKIGIEFDAPEYFGTVIGDPTVESNLPVLNWFVENTGAAQTRSGTHTSMFFREKFYDNIYANLHGQSTSGGSFPKKSFNIDLNPGHRFEFAADQAPVTDFNLLTNYADKTKVRNTIAYETYRDADHAHHIAFPIRVQRNGSFFSLHDWVGEAGEEYLERLGIDPKGALYKVNNPLNSTTNNVEKRTRKWDDRSDLQALVDSPSLSTAERNAWWFDNLDIAAWVNFLATMVVTGGTDCCHKNYYVYRDSDGTGQWQILPWDLDLNFGHNWNSSETYFDDDLIYAGGINHGNTVITPLYSAPGFREMYQRRVRTLMDELLQPPDTPLNELKYEARIDELIAQIGGDAALDQAMWGFHSNMTEQTPQEAAEDVKNFYLPERRDYLYGRSDIPDAQIETPEIVVGKIEAEPLSGIVDEQFVRLNNPGPAAVDISHWRLVGDIDLTFRSGTVIPAGGSLFAVANVKAFLNRSSGPRGGQTRFVQGEFSGRLPATGADVRLVPFDPNPSPAQTQLRITELNYNPYDAFTALGDLDVDNDQFEFVELTNVGTETLNLEGVRFTDGFDFAFGDVDLAAGEQALVVRNRAAFESRYAAGHSIAGEFAAGGLNNGGETIRLEDDLGGVVVQFTYSDGNGWPGRADGAGATLEVVDPQADYNDPDNWQSSRWFGGTPGSAATHPEADVFVNEVLTRAAETAVDQIELHNTTNHPVDVSGWYLSDDRDNLLRFTIPDNTTIAAGDYLVFDQAQFGFALSGTGGDDVWLLEAGAHGRPRRFADKVDFAATDLGVTLGRWPNGDPNGTLFPMAQPTLGAANSGPARGAVVISEINYNPVPAGGFFHDFDDGTDGGLLPLLGAWQVRDGGYEVAPDPDGDTLALIPAVASPTGQMRLTATLNVPSVSDFRKNAALIFDYHGPDDFKFVLMPTGPEEWRIGQRDAEGWQFLAIVSDRLVDTDVDMEVTVELRGSSARLVVDGLLKTNYDFGTPIEDGQLGLGSNQGVARFDNVKVEPLGDWQQFEFVEIVATASEPVDLTGWQLHDGVEMAFSPGTTIGPGETIVVVNFDPADADQAEAFRGLFGIDESVRLAGPYTGRLDNGGDLVRLSKPVDASNSETGLILVDQIDYDDLSPWPVEADGQGATLSRTSVTAFGGFASSWTAIAPTPGNVQIAAAGDMNLDGKVDGHDVAGFVMALNDPAEYQVTYGVPATATGDMDGNGDVDFDDIAGFVALVLG